MLNGKFLPITSHNPAKPSSFRSAPECVHPPYSGAAETPSSDRWERYVQRITQKHSRDERVINAVA